MFDQMEPSQTKSSTSNEQPVQLPTTTAAAAATAAAATTATATNVTILSDNEANRCELQLRDAVDGAVAEGWEVRGRGLLGGWMWMWRLLSWCWCCVTWHATWALCCMHSELQHSTKARQTLVAAPPFSPSNWVRPIDVVAVAHSCGCCCHCCCCSLQFLCFAFRILMFAIAINCGQPMQPMRRNSLIITTTITAMQWSRDPLTLIPLFAKHLLPADLWPIVVVFVFVFALCLCVSWQSETT